MQNKKKWIKKYTYIKSWEGKSWNSLYKKQNYRTNRTIIKIIQSYKIKKNTVDT